MKKYYLMTLLEIDNSTNHKFVIRIKPFLQSIRTMIENVIEENEGYIITKIDRIK